MMDLYTIIVSLILLLNIIFAIVIIFLENKDPGSTWAWLMVLTFIPILGFILYLLLGQNLYRQHLFLWEDRKKIGISQIIAEQTH